MTSIDLTPSPEDHHVLGVYKTLMNLVNQIDEKLDAGSENARKKELVDSMISDNYGSWSVVTEKLLPQFENMSGEELVGNFYGIVRTLNDAFKKIVDDYVTKEFENLPVVEQNLSEAEKKALGDERSKLYQQVKAAISMADTFGIDLGDDPMPKRRGAVGKRGKRALSLYNWTIDGVALDEDDNDPKGVAAKLGFEKASKLTEYLKTLEIDGKKINTTNPPEEFSFSYNGKDVYAKREADTEVGDDEDDEDDE